MDRPGDDPADDNHSTDGALFDVLQRRRQAVVPALHAVRVRARLPQLPERSVGHVHQVSTLASVKLRSHWMYTARQQ